MAATSEMVEPRSELRKAATAEAARDLGAIVADGTARISRAIWRASVGKVSDAVVGFSGRARDAGARLLARVRSDRLREQPELG